jgi:serine/threonine-protein kinase
MSKTMVSADDAPAAVSAEPVAFGRYRLASRIGIGGMAEVYRALVKGPQGWERELVVKRILPQLSGNAEFTTMFIREAKISALLVHPNIVQIYEFGEADGTYFIAMEHVQGVTVREALTKLKRAQRAMPFMVAADIARQVCTGLDYAHTLRSLDGARLQIVHQDVSPTNIMLAYNGTAKLLDFGIARAASFAEEEKKTGVIKGKVSYLAPEQVRLRPLDHRVDIFALGAVLHEMLTGVRLFQAKNDIRRLKQLLEQPIHPPSAVNAAIPRELDRIVMKALELEPAQRYESAAVMASDLERTLIAARYSSRDLSKLLHGLFLPSEEPLVVVDGQSATRAKTPAPPKAVAAATDRMRPVRAERPAPLSGVLSAEQSRLVWGRWWVRAKVIAGAVVVGAVLGATALAFHRYVPAMLAPTAPAAAAAATTIELAPAPAPPPAPAAKPAPKRALRPAQ